MYQSMYDASEVNVVSFVCLWSNMFLYTANMVIKEYQFFFTRYPLKLRPSLNLEYLSWMFTSN